MVNLVGGNDSLVFDGSSVAIGPDGRVLAQGASFAEDLVVLDTAGGEVGVPAEGRYEGLLGCAGVGDPGTM